MRSEAVSSPRTGIALLPVLTAALGALMLAVVASPARAGTFEVTNTNDSGTGSLRQAITEANANGDADTIEINATGTVVLGGALPELTTDMGIVGPGADQLTVKRSEALGTPVFRIFTVGEAATVSISGVTVTNGLATYCGEYDSTCGGGIGNYGTLTVTGSTITENSTPDYGGDFGLSFGGGIYTDTDSTLTVEDSTVSGNSSDYVGGGIVSDGIANTGGTITVTGSTISGNTAGDAGGISSNGPLTITGSTISGNTAEFGYGGGIDKGAGGPFAVTDSTISGNTAELEGGGIHHRNSSLTVEGSTITGNTAGFDGGGIHSYIDASITDPTIITTISNTTVSGNSAGSGGGVFSDSGLTVIEYSTITGNSATEGEGGGVASFGDDRPRTEVSSSIVTGNQNSDVGLICNPFLPDCPNTFGSGGHNLIGDGTAIGVFDAAGDRTGVSAQQAFGTDTPQLADNGGPTRTVALQAGSTAIDRVPPGTNGCGEKVQTDQRGAARIAVDGGGDGICDTGAFEFVGLAHPPDRDGDAIPDSSDACPDQPAPGTANGCPPPPDTTAPTGSVRINNGAAKATSLRVRLSLRAADNRGGTGVSRVCVSNTRRCTKWLPYSTTKAWTLSRGKAGTRTVYVRFEDKVGNVSALYKDTIRYAPLRK